MDRTTGRSRGFGFVEMPVDSAAQEAIKKLEGTQVEGRPISVSLAKPKSGGQSDSFSRGRSSRW